MKKIVSQIILIATLTILLLYGIVSIAIEESEELISGIGIKKEIIKPYSFKSSPYPAITQFPVDGTVFDSNVHYFCIQHGVSYGGKNINNTLGSGYHNSYTVTKNKWGSGNGNYTSDMRGDLDETADFYTTGQGKVVDNSNNKEYYGYKDKGEIPRNTPITNWIYESQNVTFDCEGGSEQASLAFLFACYISGQGNNTYSRGNYEDDPLQTAVWDSWLNTGNSAGNVLKAQGDAYVKYHNDSRNPNIDVIPSYNVGTTLSGGIYTIGPFKMSKYVRAKDYLCPKSNGSSQTLQDAFGGAADLQGTIIKAEAIVTNGSGAKKSIQFSVPEPDATFYISLKASDISGYDELYDIKFTYQRIHACGNGTKYIGSQYIINFSEKSSVQSSCSYSCPNPASGCGECQLSTSPGRTSKPYINSTCSHVWHTGCWNTYDGYCNGCRCDGGHEVHHPGPGHYLDDHSGCWYTYDGYCGGCYCTGKHKVHHSGTRHSDTHTVTYLCRTQS